MGRSIALNAMILRQVIIIVKYFTIQSNDTETYSRERCDFEHLYILKYYFFN